MSAAHTITMTLPKRNDYVVVEKPSVDQIFHDIMTISSAGSYESQQVDEAVSEILSDKSTSQSDFMKQIDQLGDLDIEKRLQNVSSYPENVRKTLVDIQDELHAHIQSFLSHCPAQTSTILIQQQFTLQLERIQKLRSISLKTVNQIMSSLHSPSHKVKGSYVRYVKTGKSRSTNPLSDDAVELMMAWYNSHLDHPYPNSEEKAMLIKETGLTRKQVNGWFSNRRIRAQQRNRELQEIHERSLTITK
eukprot:TRINITY_DN31842_c0_g1_i1.p1 TRINITY_DN31842_c0_g1~~TRINITY_DN31842_c0_g1_i1.p1  ORF type:complete len:247 (+),score=46.11 TRINITY_DN31842_c0_g1_i1:61-801(+)